MLNRPLNSQDYNNKKKWIESYLNNPHKPWDKR